MFFYPHACYGLYFVIANSTSVTNFVSSWHIISTLLLFKAKTNSFYFPINVPMFKLSIRIQLSWGSIHYLIHPIRCGNPFIWHHTRAWFCGATSSALFLGVGTLPCLYFVISEWCYGTRCSLSTKPGSVPLV